MQDYDMNEMCARGMLETWVRKISKDFCGKRMYIHPRVHARVHMNICMHAHTRTYTRACTHAEICARLHLFTHPYTHMHITHSGRLRRETGAATMTNFTGLFSGCSIIDNPRALGVISGRECGQAPTRSIGQFWIRRNARARKGGGGP